MEISLSSASVVVTVSNIALFSPFALVILPTHIQFDSCFHMAGGRFHRKNSSGIDLSGATCGCVENVFGDFPAMQFLQLWKAKIGENNS